MANYGANVGGMTPHEDGVQFDGNAYKNKSTENPVPWTLVVDLDAVGMTALVLNAALTAAARAALEAVYTLAPTDDVLLLGGATSV